VWYRCEGNVLSGNNVLDNAHTAIRLGYDCSQNTLRENTVSGNLYGLQFTYDCNDNAIYNNSFVDNRYQQHLVQCSGNLFNLARPVGGNYWSNWAPPEHPDADGDGFVDEPYVFSGGRDNLPWATPGGWLNRPPVAVAGDGQTVHPGMVVTLDGSGSSDPDEDYPLTFFWQVVGSPPGSLAEPTAPDTVSPSFIPDVMGDYTIQLVVTDSRGLESAPDEVTISTYNTDPVADAGEDQAVIILSTTVQLGMDEGRPSYDPDGDPITYLWTMDQKPDGSLAELDDPTAATPTFVADIQGEYVITLVVEDPWVSGDPDTVVVSFDNVQPVADAGGNQSVMVGDTVWLDGGASHDVNLDPLTFAWSIVSQPEGSQAQLSDPAVVEPTFVADQAGTYVVSLVVNDGWVDSDPANVTIEAITCADVVGQTLRDTIAVINDLPPGSLKNKNMTNALTNKINASLGKIDTGVCGEALDKLGNDVVAKTDGCANGGEPDPNDWLITCEAQDQVYPLLMDAVSLLEDGGGPCCP
jgi:parallel beta-helix repeat protein